MIVYAWEYEGFVYHETLAEAKRTAAAHGEEGETIEVLSLDLGPVTKSLVMSVLKGEGFVRKMATVCIVKGTR